MSSDITLIKPFGPSILKVKIPEKILNELNKYINETLSDKEKSNKLNYGSKLIGDVTQEFKLENDFIKKIGWADFLAIHTSKWIEAALKKK